MGKQEGCQQPEGKEVQAWDRVGQPAVEMASASGKAERPIKTEVFVPLAMAVASTTEAYKEELSLEALDCISSFPLLGEAGRRCTVFLHLALLTLTSHCPQEEP